MLYYPLAFVDAETQSGLGAYEYSFHEVTRDYRASFSARHQRVVHADDLSLEIRDCQDPVDLYAEWHEHQTAIAGDGSSQRPEGFEKLVESRAWLRCRVLEFERGLQRLEHDAVEGDALARSRQADTPQESVYDTIVEPMERSDRIEALVIKRVAIVEVPVGRWLVALGPRKRIQELGLHGGAFFGVVDFALGAFGQLVNLSCLGGKPQVEDRCSKEVRSEADLPLQMQHLSVIDLTV